MPDAVDTVVCAPDDGWWYNPKHVEQFPDKINCVTLHLVGHLLEILTMHGPMNVKLCNVASCWTFIRNSYDARTRER